MTRVQMQLSRPTLLAFKEFKRLAYGDEELNATNGYIVGVALKELLPYISSEGNIENIDLVNQIDWETYDKEPLSNVTDSDDTDTVRTKTTLTLEHSVDNALNHLQKEFKEIFKVNRVYKAFVVKMILYAAIRKRID